MCVLKSWLRNGRLVSSQHRRDVYVRVFWCADFRKCQTEGNPCGCCGVESNVPVAVPFLQVRESPSFVLVWSSRMREGGSRILWKAVQ